MNRLFQFVCSSVLACSLSSCGTTTGSSGSSVSSLPASAGDSRALAIVERHLDLIVLDLVTAMVQVHELVPLTTTLQVSEPRGAYGKKLVDALESAGYGLQWVSADQGDNYLSYENRIIRSDRRDTREFAVSVGDIRLHREYKVESGRVVPSSVVDVSGTRGFSPVVLDESIFLQQGGIMSFVSGVEFELLDSSRRSTRIRDVKQSGAVTAAAAQTENSVQVAISRTLNQDSNSLLLRIDEFRPLRRVRFTFTDDSLILGRQNKALVKLFLQDFDPVDDALFVSGCATGDEPQEHADEHVARLKEEFILNNVPVARVVEQGCALEEYPVGEDIPEHTVVVVQRRLDADAQVAVVQAPQSFPNRPLSVTIPNSIGGATDYQARIVTMMAGEQDVLGQSVLTINKPGKGGQDGWSWFAETAGRSGYELAVYNVPDMIAQSIKYSTQYNIDTMEPIANWGADPVVLAVPANSQLRNFQQLVTFARQNPRRLTVSGGGLYVGHHIALLQMEQAANISVDYLPADDAEEAMHQIEEGEVMAGFNDLSDAIRHSDEIRILAIADTERHPLLPSVPTFSELGVNIDNRSTSYRGLMVPRGTTERVIGQLSAAAVRMFNHPVTIGRLEEAQVPMKVMNRTETLALWREQQRLLGEFFKGL